MIFLCVCVTLLSFDDVRMAECDHCDNSKPKKGKKDYKNTSAIKKRQREDRDIFLFLNKKKASLLFFAIYLKYIPRFFILCRTLMKFQVAIAESVFTCADRFLMFICFIISVLVCVCVCLFPFLLDMYPHSA